jgi:hypothetical protein
MTTAEGRPSGRFSIVRLLAAGGSNTVLTLVLFAILAWVIPPWLALLGGRWIFRDRSSHSRKELVP